MKKMMFNDALGLTQAVLKGRKTQTRREIKCPRTLYGNVAGFEERKSSKGFREVVALDYEGRDIGAIEPTYKIGEVVAIAQSYEDILKEECGENADEITFNELFYETHSRAGLRNKMFVKTDIMRHHILVTDIRVERLQDISVDDCYAEGICYNGISGELSNKFTYDNKTYFSKAKEAYQALIDKLDKKMWERNPYVFVYDFELVD